MVNYLCIVSLYDATEVHQLSTSVVVGVSLFHGAAVVVVYTSN